MSNLSIKEGDKGRAVIEGETESVCERERPRGLSSRYLWNAASNLCQAAGESRWAVQVSSLTHSPIHTHTHTHTTHKLSLTVSKTLTRLFSFCHALSCVLCSLYPILPEPHTLFLTLVLNIMSLSVISLSVLPVSAVLMLHCMIQDGFELHFELQIMLNSLSV